MKYVIPFAFSLLILTFSSSAQVLAPKTTVPYKKIGVLKTRNTHEIKSSNWSVGGETMDRDYTEYKYWAPYLEDLGIKKIRLQGGWAKCEKQEGIYDWHWLDTIIFDLPNKGITPWVCLSYSNPLYGTGGVKLGSKIDTNRVAMSAWLNWVKAMVTRYKSVVHEWEIWNEPNGGKNSPERYAKLLIPTAELIRKIDPDAGIIGFAEAGIDFKFSEGVLRILKQENKIELVNYLCYHPYNFNPDESYSNVDKLDSLMKSYAPDMKLFQGENGAPSEWIAGFALSRYQWTELSQAKWFLRRMLGDLARDIPSSVFTIIDISYPNIMNRKGLLYANDDKTVNHKKQSYYAVQNLVSIFDDNLEKIPGFSFTSDASNKLSVYGYRDIANGSAILPLWLHDDRPTDYNGTTAINLRIKGVTFKDPVWVDLRTGYVYDIPKSSVASENGVTNFTNLPVYDSPVLLAERNSIQTK